MTAEKQPQKPDDSLNALANQVDNLTLENAKLQRQVAWFQRQLFGRKSEKRIFDSPMQETLSGLFPEEGEIEKTDKAVTVAEHSRKKKVFSGTPDDSGLRFNANEVPVKEIKIDAPELSGSNASQYEIIRYENTYRLAQRQGSYEILKYTRPVLKHVPTKTLITTPAPENAFGKSLADVSFVAGMLVDKFTYHLPLYRQHQRLKASYIEVSRTTLTNLVEKASLLLEPIASAVLASILKGTLIAMDETPTKAGRTKKKGAKRGQMKQAWYWPLYGEHDEVYFHFSSSRGAGVVHTLLSGFNGTLLTDGYAAYQNYAKHTENLVHALCWSHTRRYFEKSLDDEPELANYAMDMISAMYAHEETIRKKQLSGEDKQAYRGENSKPIVDKIFKWCTTLVDRPDLIATESPIISAIKYTLKREVGLRAFLADSELPLDTNHVERTLRVIPCGRKNWNFSWTELGAHYVGIIQTLLSSCKLQGIDPYTYLVDVMQRVDRHPASKVDELIPRNWKEKFGDNPIGSDLA